MALCIHGVIDSDRGLDDPVAGLLGAAVRSIPRGGLGAVVSEVDDEVRRAVQRHALRHGQVAQWLMARFTVLPFRFPTVFDTQEALVAWLDERGAELRDELARLRGKAEFGLRVIWPGARVRARLTLDRDRAVAAAPARPTASAALGYIRRRLAEHRMERRFEAEADSRIALVDARFAPSVSEKKLERLKTRDMVLSALYLVPNERHAEFFAAFQRLRSEPGELKYLLSGPWPPYNFVTTALREARP